MGCVTQAGEQAYNIARNSAIAAGLPDHVAGATLDAQCGSSQQAVNVAAALVASGIENVVVAAGVESMSRVPLRTAIDCGPGDPLSDAYRERVEVVNQGESAERIADRWGVDRLECDEIGLRSQLRAKAARDEGRFDREIVPITVDDATITADQGIRDTTAEALAALKPAFRPDGRHTAGNSSQISDGAAALVVASRRWAERNGVPIRAVIRAQAFVGVDPVLKLTGPIPATRAVLDRSGLTVDDIDVFEISEAFASVVAAWMREFGVSDELLNVNGGAIALGHPVGASGARLIVSALHELERRGAERALVAMCCGGGLGTGTLIERVE
jgi:acetyl-CoA acetyltransferase family protein